jgi:hypothetical protein
VGIAVGGKGVRITRNLISGNEDSGILDSGESTYVAGNLILDNTADLLGGGVYIFGGSPVYINNLIAGNYSNDRGGGMFIKQSTPTIINTTIVGNEARNRGDGITFVECTVGVTLTNCILWNNSPEEIQTYYSDQPTITHSLVDGGYPGEGNIDTDPLFTTGPLGDYYLSNTQTGQPADSPCFDAGSTTAGSICYDTFTDTICLDQLTTRTDAAPDLGTVDMGWHYEGVTVSTWLVTAPGPSLGNPPLVRLFLPEQDADHILQFSAYGSPQYGANISSGDMNGDAACEILTGPGPGEIYGPHVRGFQVNGTPLAGLNFLAYGTSRYGVNVAAGDIDADGFDEIITGPGPGEVFGPHVRGWDYDGSGSVTAMTGVSYFAYGTPRWGVNVSAGDIDGDGFDEIVTGAGPGAVYGPHVRGWNYDNTAITAIPTVSFMAYGTYQYGVNVTCGDVDGDGMDEIVTAPGPGIMFGAHIRGWDYDGTTVTPLPGLSFFAYEYPLARYGAKVFAGTDLDGDGRDELVTGCGPDPTIGTRVRVFRYDGSGVSEWFWLSGYVGMTHGVNVAAGRF